MTATADGGQGTEDPGFGVYFHWPFCRSKCPYCDFNSHVAATVDQGRWRAALARELTYFAGDAARRTVTSIFFGGGTPSLMGPDTVAGLVDAVGETWPVAEDLEVTLEANPTSVEAGRFEAYRAAGVNRLSLGVQALDDKTLALLGREHSAREALEALALAAAHFPRFSFDLIYARPGQTAAAWRRELAAALAGAGGHVSLYQLTIEPGTAFHLSGVAAAGEAKSATLYGIAQEMLAGVGLPAYEVSNHARPGDECRHNLTTWRGGDYLGIGPGAHGRLTSAEGGPGATEATNQTRVPEHWLAAVEARGHGTARRTRLSARHRSDELVLLGLRLGEGIERRRFRRLTGGDIEAAVDGAALERLCGGGFLVVDEKGLRTTNSGRLRLNAVLAALLS